MKIEIIKKPKSTEAEKKGTIFNNMTNLQAIRLCVFQCHVLFFCCPHSPITIFL